MCFALFLAATSRGLVTLFKKVVPRAGLEPARPCGHKILSLACIPISPPRHVEPGLSYFILKDLTISPTVFTTEELSSAANEPVIMYPNLSLMPNVCK